MKKSIFFKLLIVMGLILTVVTLLSASVLAADDDPWDNVQVVDTDPNGTNTNGTGNTPVDTNTPNTNSDNSNSNTNISDITGDTDFNFDDDDNNVNINTGNADANSSKDDLAYTGAGNTTKIVVLTAIIGGIVAIYSYKKVSDYRNL